MYVSLCRRHFREEVGDYSPDLPMAKHATKYRPIGHCVEVGEPASTDDDEEGDVGVASPGLNISASARAEPVDAESPK